MTKNEKISHSLKSYFKEHGHHNKGKAGWAHSEEQKELKRQKTLEYFDKVGRVSEQHKKARNKANVYAYRARKKNLIKEDSDLSLISEIYKNCPEGYDVDHIIPLRHNGPHHQDNLRYLTVSENRRKGAKLDYAPPEDTIIEWKEIIPRGPQGVAADC